MKKTDAYSALVRSPALDAEKYVVSVLVMRRDGKAMTADDLAIAGAAYPPAELERDLPSNPEDDEILAAGRALGAKKPAKKVAKRGAKKASKRAA